MSERNISISPYAKADNLIDLKGYVSLEGVEEKIEIPEKKHLILYNYSLANGDIIVPRKLDSLRIFLKPVFAKGHSQNDFHHLVLNGESAENTLKLRLQVWCKVTRWCSNQLTLNLSEANGRKEIYFDIPVSDVKEELVVSGFITREKGRNVNEPRKANAIYSVLSTCDEISIQIDERKEIGGNHLPIFPEDIGELLFDIHGLENDFELPVIKYSEDFKEYFVKDNLNTVNTTFMMAMFYFLDSYLKWLIFNCKYDTHDKNHKGLVETFSKYCGISKANLVDLVEERKYSENQVKQYLTLSHNLLHGIQVNSPVKYAKELKLMIKEESK
jgi:hypothetical protein